MGVSERKDRERFNRQQRIVGAARDIARKQGWGAVTIRRIADEIEYSQPVVYSHFESRDAIVSAVAIEGFTALTLCLRSAARRSASQAAAMTNLAEAYLTFAIQNPWLYEVMFEGQTALRFGDENTLPELQEAFEAISSVVGRETDSDGVAAETFWAMLHGLVSLEASKRLRASHREARLKFVIDSFVSKFHKDSVS